MWKAKDISLYFFIVLYVLVHLSLDRSVLSIFVILILISAIVLGGLKKPILNDNFGNVVQNSDSILNLIKSRLEEWKEYDENLFEQIKILISKFYNGYVDILMNVNGGNEQNLTQDFDILWFQRNQIIEDLYEYTYKSSNIPNTFSNDITLPFIALSRKYVKVLCNKYQSINTRYKELLNQNISDEKTSSFTSYI